jgi:ATP-dependent Lon protease
LEADHYGLEKAKERILEYLAVQQLRGSLGRGPVLCLVGPPGVGKTSLAKSIARATARKFVRMSLGGVRDEAEIRGHRRTYVGALPGKIIHSVKRAGTSNPVILLDEVDKMSMDFRGDPSAALLEVLDPEQNEAFVDHYIDLDYDLSKVLFITTANNLQSIPWALQDRLEIIELGGYTEYDKLQIAKKYLVPRQIEENGLQKLDVQMSEDALQFVVRSYTREAGVRSLERQVGAICRKIATGHLEAKGKKSSDSKNKRWRIGAKQVRELLGPERFRLNESERQDRVGVCNGLAVTSAGGDLLLVEVSLVPGKGKLTVTGKLGDVMKESVEAAMSYVRARAHQLGLGKEFYQKLDLHVHFPEGAIPKDGPSAGIAIGTAIVSSLTQIPVRHDVAMTGEITLRGRVLAIGGLKEKVIAAARAGVLRVIIPKENERDLEEIPKDVLKTLEIVPVDHVDQVLRAALRLEDPKSFLSAPARYARDYLGIYEDEARAEATH